MQLKVMASTPQPAQTPEGVGMAKGQLTPDLAKRICRHLDDVRKMARRIADDLTTRLRVSHLFQSVHEELYSVGCLGIVEAALKYDPAQGEFWAFAKLRVKGAMLDAIRDGKIIVRNISLSRHDQKRLQQLRTVEEKLRHRLQRSPTEEELRRELDLNECQFTELRMLRALARVRVSGEGQEESIRLLDSSLALTAHLPLEGDMSHRASSFKALSSSAKQGRVNEAMWFLHPTEREILGWIYGLQDRERVLGQNVAWWYGVTHSRFSQIKQRAIQRLRYFVTCLATPDKRESLLRAYAEYQFVVGIFKNQYHSFLMAHFGHRPATLPSWVLGLLSFSPSKLLEKCNAHLAIVRELGLHNIESLEKLQAIYESRRRVVLPQPALPTPAAASESDGPLLP